MKWFTSVQGDLVRQLKADGAGDIDVQRAVAELKHRKKALEDKVRLGYSSVII